MVSSSSRWELDGLGRQRGWGHSGQHWWRSTWRSGWTRWSWCRSGDRRCQCRWSSGLLESAARIRPRRWRGRRLQAEERSVGRVRSSRRHCACTGQGVEAGHGSSEPCDTEEHPQPECRPRHSWTGASKDPSGKAPGRVCTGCGELRDDSRGSRRSDGSRSERGRTGNRPTCKRGLQLWGIGVVGFGRGWRWFSYWRS